MRLKISLKTTASAFALITILTSFTTLQAMKKMGETPELWSTPPARKPENEKKSQLKNSTIGLSNINMDWVNDQMKGKHCTFA